MTDGGPFHGFVDESIRTDGLYRLTVVRVRARDLARTTRAMRERVPRGQTRIHFSAESDQRRRSILRVYLSLEISATSYQTPYDRRSDDQPARDRCIRALAGDVPVLGVAAVVFDTRGPRRDRLDRAALRRALLAAGLDHVTYSHRGSRDEVLLGLPDAFGWAVGAGPAWRRLLGETVDVRQVSESG
jgi:hypothetical protein